MRIAPMISTLLVALPALAAPRRPAATIGWEDFYDRVSNAGVTYSARLRSLEGLRVRLRGYSVGDPKPPGGLFLTRLPHLAPESAHEDDLPYDAVGVLWKRGIALPPVPGWPTVEGILRLGNRSVGGYIVNVTLEEARPVIPASRAPSPNVPRARTGAISAPARLGRSPRTISGPPGSRRR